MKKLWILALSTMALAYGGEVLSPAQFQKMMRENRGKLLDVRTPREYSEGHLPNAVNLDYYNKNFKSELAKLPKDKVYYVYCRSGGRSGKTVAMLKAAGFENVYDLQGGITKWIADGMPVSTRQ